MVVLNLTHFAFAASLLTSAFAAPVENITAEITDRDAPDFDIGPHSLFARQDYNQNYKTSGTVNVSPTGNGYSVSFSGAQDFVVGKGWSTGSYTRAVTFSGSTSASAGTVLVSLYGWSQNPLIEYYVQEWSNGQGAAQGTYLGNYYTDGAYYNVYKHTQYNQPSIVGTATFDQYISVRQSPRPNGGTITFGNHVYGWQQFGLKLGQLNYQTISTEGWGNAQGYSQYTVSGSG
ncbi:family 11 glycosyl hydrolase [Truncatella angustata]|uniref:Endo-1,4-beta-xylanase n=1 Tax=Truncatella angustata TaxID=152316 RepID=A0A9P8UQ54_9PEZI|nr:family 11 glycosyl hydrolase [Truncatella angustata]KAH6656014.1 family 11 glycosyl hydrolase [Truncatella angustata]KAH8200976.1 hypothetical protein TruAng_004835 [Truncatella angustata]